MTSETRRRTSPNKTKRYLQTLMVEQIYYVSLPAHYAHLAILGLQRYSRREESFRDIYLGFGLEVGAMGWVIIVQIQH